MYTHNNIVVTGYHNRDNTFVCNDKDIFLIRIFGPKSNTPEEYEIRTNREIVEQI